MSDAAKKVEAVGKGIQQAGCLLTGIITFPLIGFVIGGPIGLVIGLLVGALIVAGVVKQKKEQKEKAG